MRSQKTTGSTLTSAILNSQTQRASKWYLGVEAISSTCFSERTRPLAAELGQRGKEGKLRRYISLYTSDHRFGYFGLNLSEGRDRKPPTGDRRSSTSSDEDEAPPPTRPLRTMLSAWLSDIEGKLPIRPGSSLTALRKLLRPWPRISHEKNRLGAAVAAPE